MSQFDIEIVAEFETADALKDAIRKAVEAALSDQDEEPGASCTVLLTDDDHIQQLNRDFLGYDQPTDVLSFPAGEPMPGSAAYLGDIAVSVPTARRQAASGGHDVASELQLLTVHAVLHLLGYDHATDEDKAQMWATQARILKLVGAEIFAPRSE